MSSDASPDTPLARAIKERDGLQKQLREATEAIEKIDSFITAYKGLPSSIAQSMEPQIAPLMQQRQELESKLKPFVQRLSQLEQFLSTWRSLATSEQANASASEQSSLSRAGRGMTQSLFERLAVMVLRDAQRPMQSGEFVDEFRKRGHEIGGENETKTAWNRLWQARRDGVLVHVASLGYWLPGEDLPPGAEEAALAARAERKKESRGKGRKLGRPKSKRRGKRRLLSDAQIAAAEQWLASGMPATKVCAELGGISVATLWNNIPGRAKGLRERHPERAANIAARPKRPRPPRPYRERKLGDKKLGRPPNIAGEKAVKAEAMYLDGASMKEIADAIDVKLTSAYRYFGGDRREDWERRRNEHQAQQRNRRR